MTTQAELAEAFERACKLIRFMGDYVGQMAPGDYDNFYADLNAHWGFEEGQKWAIDDVQASIAKPIEVTREMEREFLDRTKALRSGRALQTLRRVIVNGGTLDDAVASFIGAREAWRRRMRGEG